MQNIPLITLESILSVPRKNVNIARQSNAYLINTYLITCLVRSLGEALFLVNDLGH